MRALTRCERRQPRRYVFTIETRIAGWLCVRFFGCRGRSHRRSGIRDESFKFNHSHVFHGCIGGCVQRCKRPNGHATATANANTNRHESTIGDRRSVDQFDPRPLDRIATQIMALAGSTLPWLGVPLGVAKDIHGTTVKRIRDARTSCTIGLPSRGIRGSPAFGRRIDGLFSGCHARYQLECLG